MNKTQELYRLAFEHYKKAKGLMNVKEAERQTHLPKMQHEINLCNILLHEVKQLGGIETIPYDVLPDPELTSYSRFREHSLNQLSAVIVLLGELYFPKFRKDELKRETPLLPTKTRPLNPHFSILGYITDTPLEEES